MKKKDFTKKEKVQMKKNVFAILKNRYYDIVVTEQYVPDFGRYTNYDGSATLADIKDLEYRFKCVCLLEIYNEYAKICPVFTGSLEHIHLANFLADLYNEEKYKLLSTHDEAYTLHRVID